MKRFAFLLLLAGCDALPRDTEGTLDRIHAAGVVRVGLVAERFGERAGVAALTDRIALDAGARVIVTTGASEPLLAALDEGKLDLVVAAFGEKTPWATDVSLAPPIARYTIGKTPMLVRAAVRNGENDWAMLVEHAARQVAPELASAG